MKNQIVVSITVAAAIVSVLSNSTSQAADAVSVATSNQPPAVAYRTNVVYKTNEVTLYKTNEVIVTKTNEVLAATQTIPPSAPSVVSTNVAGTNVVTKTNEAGLFISQSGGATVIANPVINVNVNVGITNITPHVAVPAQPLVIKKPRAATNAAGAAPGSVTNRVTPPAKKTRAEKNPPPPVVVAPDSGTKDTNTFMYKQELWVPRTEAEMASRDRAVARLEGREQGVWGYTGPAQAAPSQSLEYVVDQRPLDQTGHFPTPSGNYPMSGNYPAPSWNYPVPNGNYPAPSWNYPTTSCGVYPAASYSAYPYYPYNNGYGLHNRYYGTRGNWFGISVGALISSSYCY